MSRSEDNDCDILRNVQVKPWKIHYRILYCIVLYTIQYNTLSYVIFFKILEKARVYHWF